MHTCVYGRGPFKQEYIPAANRIRRQIRVQLHYFIFSFLGGTPIRKRLPAKFTKFQCTMHKINCYTDMKTLLLKGHVQTFPPSVTVQTAFLPAFSQTFPR